MFSSRIITVNHFDIEVWDEIIILDFQDLKAMVLFLVAVILEYKGEIIDGKFDWITSDIALPLHCS